MGVATLPLKMNDINTKKDFRILSNLMYKEDIYWERKNFLLKCRFYNLHPKHIDYITQQTKNNHMFSHNYQIIQNNLIKKIQKELLNTEIMDIHACLAHIRKCYIRKNNR